MQVTILSVGPMVECHFLCQPPVPGKKVQLWLVRLNYYFYFNSSLLLGLFFHQIFFIWIRDEDFTFMTGGLFVRYLGLFWPQGNTSGINSTNQFLLITGQQQRKVKNGDLNTECLIKVPCL